MSGNSYSFVEAFNAREDLKQFSNDVLLLFVLQIKFGIEDILTVATNSLTEGGDDKKIESLYNITLVQIKFLKMSPDLV